MMSMWNRSRNGSRSLKHCLNRRCSRYATQMLGGARRPRPPNDIAIVCRALSEYLRIGQRMARRDPHLFGPRALDYYRDTLALERFEKETDAALLKVYGPAPPDQPKRVSTLWSDRYPDMPDRLFRKWFHENYPSP